MGLDLLTASTIAQRRTRALFDDTIAHRVHSTPKRKPAHRVVVIGGGFAGLTATMRLKDAPVQVTLIDRRNHHLFQPLLYQVATGALSPADIAAPLRAIVKRQQNVRVLLGEVIDIDAARRRVVLRDDTVGYDTLILAAGAGQHYFGNDHWQQWAPGLKSVEDAVIVRRRILSAFEAAERAGDPDDADAHMTFVVVGGGPTGVELAGALAEIARATLKHDFRRIDPANARILLIQGDDRVLPAYPTDLSAEAERALTRLGVTVRTGARVTDIDSDGVTISDGDEMHHIPARTVLWAAGVRASPLGRALADATGTDLDRTGRVIVEPDLSVPNHPEIFVAGDLAAYTHQTGRPLPGVAQVAMQEGRYVAELIQRRLRGETMRPFRYRDRGNLATVGRSAAVADLRRLRFSGRIAWVLWFAIHWIYLVGFENRLLVLVQWLWSLFTHDRTARLITNEDYVFAHHDTVDGTSRAEARRKAAGYSQRAVERSRVFHHT